MKNKEAVAQVANPQVQVEPLTTEQVENWRKVLSGMIGPYALIMPTTHVEAFRKRMQEVADKSTLSLEGVE